MKLRERYSRLTLWNKLSVCGSVASLVGLAWAFWPSGGPSIQADPVVEISVLQGKVVRIANIGRVPVSDLQVLATSYLQRVDYTNGHLAFSDDVEFFSKINQPVFTAPSLASFGAAVEFDLKNEAFQAFLPFRAGIPTPTDPLLRTVYCLRLTFRDASTKAKHVLYATTGALLDFPDMYGNLENAAIGGGLESSRQLFEVLANIRRHQAALFGDEPPMGASRGR